MARSVKVFAVSPGPKATRGGTPVWSLSVAPPEFVTVMGMVTVRLGSALRLRPIVTRPPSVTVWELASKLTAAWGRSSSLMSTVVAPGSVTSTRSGRAAESISSSTDSPASKSSSGTALKRNSCSVSPVWKVRLVGSAG